MFERYEHSEKALSTKRAGLVAGALVVICVSGGPVRATQQYIATPVASLAFFDAIAGVLDVTDNTSVASSASRLAIASDIMNGVNDV